MHFSTSFLATALLASSALAAPARRSSTLAERMAARQRKTVIPQFVNVTEDTYDYNWAGAVFTSPPSGTFNSVSGQFVVPTPQPGSGGDSNTEYAASAWVGIDGDTAGNSILQTGVDFYAQGDQIGFDCWYEWLPNGATTFSGITINAGDTIALSVTASSSTSGTAVIQNLSNGQTVSQDLNAPSSSAALAGQNAEWIVEDFESNGGFVPLANWGSVEFTNTAFTTTSGASGTSDGASTIDISQNGQVLSSTSINGDTVTITYE